MTASPTSIMGQFEQDEKMFAQEPAVVDFQQPEGGTPFGKLFQCCFPKEEKRTALPKQVEPEVESRGRLALDSFALLLRRDLRIVRIYRPRILTNDLFSCHYPKRAFD
jgi:hypothetical protein